MIYKAPTSIKNQGAIITIITINAAAISLIEN